MSTLSTSVDVDEPPYTDERGWREYEDDEEMEERRAEIADLYRFYVTEHTDEDGEVVGESFSLFFQREDGEFPLLQNTGGRDIINSATAHTGEEDHSDALPASEDFVDAVGVYYHQIACFTRPDPEIFESSITSMYDVEEVEEAPRHEAWAVSILAPEMFFGRAVPEMFPLAEYAYNWTEFGMPEPMPETYTPLSER